VGIHDGWRDDTQGGDMVELEVIGLSGLLEIATVFVYGAEEP